MSGPVDCAERPPLVERDGKTYLSVGDGPGLPLVERDGVLCVPMDDGDCVPLDEACGSPGGEPPHEDGPADRVAAMIWDALAAEWGPDHEGVARWLWSWLCEGEDARERPEPYEDEAPPLSFVVAGTYPTLGEVAFGNGRADPRRAAWVRASKPWGFGSMRALWTAGVMGHWRAQEPRGLTPPEAVEALGAVCEAAEQAGDAEGFEAWIRARMADPMGDGVRYETVRGPDRDRAYIAACMDHMSPDGLRRLADMAPMVLHMPGCTEEPGNPAEADALEALKDGNLPGEWAPWRR